MGRRRTVNRDLPARLYLKRDGYYYRDLNRRETKVAPADDLPKALIEWAQREGVRPAKWTATARHSLRSVRSAAILSRSRAHSGHDGGLLTDPSLQRAEALGDEVIGAVVARDAGQRFDQTDRLRAVRQPLQIRGRLHQPGRRAGQDNDRRRLRR